LFSVGVATATGLLALIVVCLSIALIVLWRQRFVFIENSILTKQKKRMFNRILFITIVIPFIIKRL